MLDESRDRLYVLTRFDNSIAIVDTSTASEIAQVALYNPGAREGPRRAARSSTTRPSTSSNGEASCSSCHVFGDLDSLGWDLGNPEDVVLNNPLPFRIPTVGIPKDFHPLKGPMTTQSLRGMANHGSMHWRGDRTGGNDPDSDAFDEVRAFEKFNPAFTGLIGRDGRAVGDRHARLHRLHPDGDLPAEPGPQPRQLARRRRSRRAATSTSGR